MKEEEGDLGTSAWTRHLNEASRIAPQVKQYLEHIEHIFIGGEIIKFKYRRHDGQVFTHCVSDSSGSVNWIIFLMHFFIVVVLGFSPFKFFSLIVPNIKMFRSIS